MSPSAPPGVMYAQQQQQQQQYGGGYGYAYPQPHSGNYGYPPQGNPHAPLMQPPNMASFNQPTMGSSFAHNMNDIHAFRQMAHQQQAYHQQMAPTTVLPHLHNPYMHHQHHLGQQGPPPRTKGDQECAVIDNRRVCQDEECGGEEKGPKKPRTAFGIDWVYGRPMALLGSTALGGYLLVVAILPSLIGRMDEATVFNIQIFAAVVTATATFLILYGMFANPGEMTEEEWEQAQAMKTFVKRDEESSDSEGDFQIPLPARAHKSWQYPRPILRYDHYCKWLANVIGLRNHRQFFVMVTLLVFIGFASVCVDLLVVIDAICSMVRSKEFALEASWIIPFVHFFYAAGMFYYVQGVFRIHFMLVLRNETAKEWKSNCNYRFELSKKGADTTWSDMSDDEQEALFGTEVYRPELNAWDKGPANNCLLFWCTSRHQGQMGDF